MSAFISGLSLGMFIVFIVFVMADFANYTNVVSGKQFIINNASYKCTKTNQLVGSGNGR